MPTALKSQAAAQRRTAGAPSAADPRVCFPRLSDLIEYLTSLKSRANLDVLARHLGALRITRADLEPACRFGVRSYRRNVIAASPWFELLALTWRSGHCTPIHDHEGVSCAFRVVHGTGTETRFGMTPSGLICATGSVQMEPGYVCAARDADIHQVANMQARGQDLITLHIYSPRIKKMRTYAFAASEGCEREAGGAECYAKPGAKKR